MKTVSYDCTLIKTLCSVRVRINQLFNIMSVKRFLCKSKNDVFQIILENPNSYLLKPYTKRKKKLLLLGKRKSLTLDVRVLYLITSCSLVFFRRLEVYFGNYFVNAAILKRRYLSQLKRSQIVFYHTRNTTLSRFLCRIYVLHDFLFK